MRLVAALLLSSCSHAEPRQPLAFREHFLTWTQERGERADRSDFLPCRLFRDYIVDLIREARQARTNGQHRHKGYENSKPVGQA